MTLKRSVGGFCLGNSERLTHIEEYQRYHNGLLKNVESLKQYVSKKTNNIRLVQFPHDFIPITCDKRLSFQGLVNQQFHLLIPY